MNSEELNKRIREIEDGREFEGQVKGIELTGKTFPYLGWGWREVDFDHPFELGFSGECQSCGVKKTCEYHEGVLELSESPDFVGFMENNKWGYAQRTVTEEQRREIVMLVTECASRPSLEALQTLFNYVQSCWT